eukprot:scaffold552_cov526-Prasinococcus_capsulatus_cf.AAC.18
MTGLLREREMQAPLADASRRGQEGMGLREGAAGAADIWLGRPSSWYWVFDGFGGSEDGAGRTHRPRGREWAWMHAQVPWPAETPGGRALQGPSESSRSATDATRVRAPPIVSFRPASGARLHEEGDEMAKSAAPPPGPQRRREEGMSPRANAQSLPLPLQSGPRETDPIYAPSGARALRGGRERLVGQHP